MGPVPYENHVRFVLATHKKVRDIATAKVNGSPTVSVLLISGAIKSKVSALKKTSSYPAPNSRSLRINQCTYAKN